MNACKRKARLKENNKKYSDFEQNVFKLLDQNHVGVEFMSSNPVLSTR